MLLLPLPGARGCQSAHHYTHLSPLLAREVFLPRLARQALTSADSSGPRLSRLVRLPRLSRLVRLSRLSGIVRLPRLSQLVRLPCPSRLPCLGRPIRLTQVGRRVAPLEGVGYSHQLPLILPGARGRQASALLWTHLDSITLLIFSPLYLSFPRFDLRVSIIVVVSPIQTLSCFMSDIY